MAGVDWRFDDLLRPAAHLRRVGVEAPWEAFPDGERDGFIKLVSPIAGRLNVGGRAQIAQCDLPWLEGGQIVRVIDPDWDDPDVVIYFIRCDRRYFALDGSSAPLHDANEAAPIRLTADNVLNYLLFFCCFVHGDDGPFYLLERADHPLLNFPMDAETRRVLESCARPPTLIGKDEDGRYLCEGVEFYGNALFTARFAVGDDGVIEMVDDDPIAADLPARVRIKLTPARS